MAGDTGSAACNLTAERRNHGGRRGRGVTSGGIEAQYTPGNLRTPFDRASFDVVWTRHATMNVADKQAFYREVTRVLVPAGRLAFFDIVAGHNQPVHFPVHWADEPRRGREWSVGESNP